MKYALPISIVLLIASIPLLGYSLTVSREAESLQTGLIPWGLPIVNYAFFTLTIAGALMFMSLHYTLSLLAVNRAFERLLKYGIWFVIATLIPAGTIIFLELGQRSNIPAMMLGFRPESRIWWMTVIYGIVAILAIVTIVFSIRGIESRITGLTISILALIAAAMLAANLSGEFGSIIAVPAWHGFHAPLFLVLGIVLGGALLSIYLIATLWARKELADNRESIVRSFTWLYVVGLPIIAFFLLWTLITASYNVSAWEFYRSLVFGGHALGFWILVVLVGIIAPLILSIYARLKQSIPPILLSSLGVIVGSYTYLYYFIIGGEIARLEANGLATIIEGAHIAEGYHIPLADITMLIGAVLLWIAILILGVILLPLGYEEKPKRLLIFK